ncbi:MAG: VWA domain-containing protein [Halobacteria archaeon]
MMFPMIFDVLDGVKVFGFSFKNPIAFAAIPILFVLLLYLMSTERFGPDIGASRKKKLAMFVTRFVVVALLITAVAQPFMVTAAPIEGQEHVKVLVDTSDSMEVMPEIVGKITSGIENQGISVEKVEIGSDRSSRIGDEVVSNLDKGGNVLLISDGRVTGGKSIDVASQIAKSLDARIYGINYSASKVESFVKIDGPSDVMKGAKSSYVATIGGVHVSRTDTNLKVTVDGNTVLDRNVDGTGRHRFNYTFQEKGSHKIQASLTGGGPFPQNNGYFKSVRVVEPPKILYMGQNGGSLKKLLTGLYDVTTKSKLPDDLSDYYAVVGKDIPADKLGQAGRLESYVLKGNGLVLFGGPNSFDKGGYSSIEPMLPVQIGKSNEVSNIVIAIDASGSTDKTMALQERVALDVLEQLGDGNKVGVVAFRASESLQGRAYSVAPFKKEQPPMLWNLGRNRDKIRDRIRRIQNFGATPIGKGLEGANELLGGSGNVILITDGGQTKDRDRPVKIARKLGVQGVNIITIATSKNRDTISNRNMKTLQRISDASGGQLLFMGQTDRLAAQFGGSDKSLSTTHLTIMNDGHPITKGLNLTANPTKTNKVNMKPGGNFLVATSNGKPAVASGFVGPGRVVTFTAFYPGGSLGDLLSSPNSLLIAKAINWAIGNPERKAENVFLVPDTKVGETTKVTFKGESPPAIDGMNFRKVDTKTYQTTIRPTKRGFNEIPGTNVIYGVNYPKELSGFGLKPSYPNAITVSGGKMFKPGQSKKIAEAVRSRKTAKEEQVVNYSWAPLVAALLIYLLEVLIRRIYEIYGYRLPSGSPSFGLSRGD